MLAAITGAQPAPQPNYTRRTVFVFVDSFDLATLAAVRYARSLRPTSLRAVHGIIMDERPGGEAARGLDTRQPRGGPRLHRRSRPQADPRGGGPGRPRGRGIPVPM